MQNIFFLLIRVLISSLTLLYDLFKYSNIQLVFKTIHSLEWVYKWFLTKTEIYFLNFSSH